MKSWFQLIRWYNLLFCALIVWLMEKMVATAILDKALFGEQLPAWILYLLMLAVVFIAAGGYAINDYFDVRIDRLNRPDKLIVTRWITKQQAMLCHQIMTGLGIACGIAVAVGVHSWSLGLIFLFVPGLMWFYSSSYKRQFFVGNLIVSLAAALTPLVVAIANVAYLNYKYGELIQYTTLRHDLYAWIGGFAVFAFLTTLCREIIKDLQDQAGDRELECHTLPIIWGDGWTKAVLTVLLLSVVGAAIYAVFCLMPLPHESWSSLSVRYLIFGLGVPMICEFYLLLSAKLPSDYRYAQQLMKFIMFVGVLFSIVIRVQL